MGVGFAAVLAAVFAAAATGLSGAVAVLERRSAPVPSLTLASALACIALLALAGTSLMQLGRPQLIFAAFSNPASSIFKLGVAWIVALAALRRLFGGHPPSRIRVNVPQTGADRFRCCRTGTDGSRKQLRHAVARCLEYVEHRVAVFRLCGADRGCDNGIGWGRPRLRARQAGEFGCRRFCCFRTGALPSHCWRNRCRGADSLARADGRSGDLVLGADRRCGRRAPMGTDVVGQTIESGAYRGSVCGPSRLCGLANRCAAARVGCLEFFRAIALFEF